jgi:hypothetical protein
MKNTEKNNLINKEKNQEIDLPKIINSEVNLLIFPFFVLTKKSNKKMTKVEYKDIIKRGNKRIEIFWQVSSNSEYGYPGLFDREVHKVIEQIITEILQKNGVVENPISFSIYNLCERMNITTAGGKNYSMVRKSLERIRMTGIKSEGTFYHKGRKQWLSKVFGLYDSIIFKGERIEDGKIAETNYLYLSDIYLQSLNSFYIKPIDYTYLQSLKSKIASRLYELLGVKFYGQKNKKQYFICYRYSKLCQLLPVTSFKQLSRSKQQLNPAHNELQNTGFISKFEWSENGKNDWLIYYWPGERARKEMKDAKIRHIDFKEENYITGPAEIDEEVKNTPDQKNDLVNQLVTLNVSKITAERLVKKYNLDTIKEWIRAINFTNADDKAAYLVKAIKENWNVPDEYLKEKESATEREEDLNSRIIQKKEKEEENKKKQEENLKLDQIYNSLDPLQQETIQKEAENRLSDFWKAQLNKEKAKGKLSKILQTTLEEKRREVIKEWTKVGWI